jgi:hypothetical protein
MSFSLKASSILVDENLWIQLAGMEYQPNCMDFGIIIIIIIIMAIKVIFITIPI